jgi:hypothetical protein
MRSLKVYSTVPYCSPHLLRFLLLLRRSSLLFAHTILLTQLLYSVFILVSFFKLP